MAEKISAAELARLRARGAEIIPMKKTVQVEGLDQISARLGEIQEAVGKRQDISSQINQLIDAITQIKLTAPEVDMSPIMNSIDALKQMIAAPKPSYVFRVERDNRGRISTVIAEPNNEL
jgi:hypothetical protein